MAYDDIRSAHFWQGLVQHDAFDDNFQRVGHKRPFPSMSSHDTHISPDGETGYLLRQNWSDHIALEPMMHKSWEFVREMTHPVLDVPCYICGDVYSTGQTWVEGTLQTAEIVLQQHFGLQPPAWLDAS